MEKDKILNKLQADFSDAKTAKEELLLYKGISKTKTEEKPYTTNKLIAYEKWYLGDQWSVYPDGSKMETGNDISKPVVNYIRTIVDEKVAMFKALKVGFDVRPVEKLDIDGATFAGDILRFIFRKAYLQLITSKLYMDSLIYGNGILKVRVIKKSVIDKDGKRVEKPWIDFSVINPVNFYPDRYGVDIKEMRYVTIAYEKTQEYVEFTYKTKVEPDNSGAVVVYETWYNPQPLFPKGAVFIWTQDKILKKIENLETISKYYPEVPIFVLRHNSLSNSFWGQSEVAHIAQIQLIHNKSLGVIIDNLLLTNNCQYKAKGDREIEITNEPGHVYPLDDMDDLQPLITPQLSPQWFALAQYTGYGTFQQESGTYATNLGGASTRTASGIMALQKAGATLTESDMADLKVLMSKVGHLILAYVKEYFEDRDVLEMSDINKSLKEISPDYDIFIQFGDALPDDKVARLNMLSQLLQVGAIDKVQFAKYVGDPVITADIEEKEKEVEQQKQLQAQMMQQQAQQASQPQQVPQKQPVGGNNG